MSKHVLLILLLFNSLVLWSADQELASYRCSRQTAPQGEGFYNARLACRLLHLAVIKKGEVFSFNDTVSRVRRYYKPGPSVEGQQTVLSLGGGICQVSTALYQAALKAGLEIVESHHHSNFLPTIDYCKPGEDAAISRPYKDLRIRNNKDFPIQLQAFTEENKTVIIKIMRKE